MTDVGYTNLLGHLNRLDSQLPLEAIQKSISFHLAKATPSPTPLVASVINSELFQPVSHDKLQTLSIAFRHAAHLKFGLLKDEKNGIFSRGLKTRLRFWIEATLRGLEGGMPILRLASAGGLLMGVDDLKQKMSVDPSFAVHLQDAVVVAAAEVMDIQFAAGWEAEFQPKAVKGEKSNHLAVVQLAQALPLAPTHKVNALDLPRLSDLLLTAIDSAFASGLFASSSDDPDILSQSVLIQHMAPISNLAARSVTLMLESRPKHAPAAMSAIFSLLRRISTRVELEMQGSENDAVWLLLKTLLFSTLLISDKILSSLIYEPHLRSVAVSTSLDFLLILNSLALVISKFGGVTAEGDFPELKKAFYAGLDILSSDSDSSVTYVLGLCDGWDGKDTLTDQATAKKAFALAAIEQLVPVIPEKLIESRVFPLCVPHLFDLSHRETFVSAHSVVLSIFASHAQKIGDGDPLIHPVGFTKRLVPFYADCLLKNSGEGRLNTPQLRLAYAALVRSASSHDDDQHVLALYCVSELIAYIRGRPQSKLPSEQLLALQLTLISTLPSIPLSILPGILEDTLAIISAVPESSPDKRALHQALFAEISERVGDREKEYFLRWWNDHYTLLAPTPTETSAIPKL